MRIVELAISDKIRVLRVELSIVKVS